MNALANGDLRTGNVRGGGRPNGPPPRASRLDRLLAPVIRRRFLAALERWRVGRLTVHLPGGQVVHFGQDPLPDVTIWIARDAFFRKLALGGDIGAGEAFMDGDWRTDDLVTLIDLLLRNRAHLAIPTRLGRVFRLADDWRHRRRRRAAASNRRNIRAHHDLSNEFFASFLDSSMAYSCALYDGDASALDLAQTRKFERWCQALELGPDDHVLDVGSGWGGFAMHAARTRGCRVTGITVSRQQLALSRARVHDSGLEDRVELSDCDYREVTGRFTKVIAIEMMEASGEASWPAFFRKVNEVLAPGGRLGLQAITMVDDRFARFRRHCGWIQKHVFPGGPLPAVSDMVRVAAAHTPLGVISLDDRPLDYARTLAEWRRRFVAHQDRVRALGFDERFIRKWEYYLSTCEAAFRTRNLGLVHLVMGRSGE